MVPLLGTTVEALKVSGRGDLHSLPTGSSTKLERRGLGPWRDGRSMGKRCQDDRRTRVAAVNELLLRRLGSVWIL